MGRGAAMPNLQNLQNLQTPPALGRQLELMGLTRQQNQHQPNPNVGLAATRNLQQQQQEQRLGGMGVQTEQMPNQMQVNFFNQRPTTMPQQGGAPQVAGNPGAGARPALTQQQLRERAQLLVPSIKELEKQSLLHQAGRNGRSDTEYFNELRKIQSEIANRRGVLLKVAQTMQLGMGAAQPQPAGSVWVF